MKYCPTLLRQGGGITIILNIMATKGIQMLGYEKIRRAYGDPN